MVVKSVHSRNKSAKSLTILGKSLIQKINKQIVYADHSLINNFTQTNKKFVLSIRYYKTVGKLFVNGKKQTDFICLNSEIKPYKMCLGNISADFSSTNALRTGLHGNVYDFRVSYKIFSDSEIHDIHAYLMKKNDIV